MMPHRFTQPAGARRRFLALAGGAFAAGLTAPAMAQFRIEIAGVGGTRIPVTLAAFRDEQASGVAVSDIVRADLERSGLFRTARVVTAMDERSSLDVAQWRTQGADAVVAGSVTRLADGRFDVRYKLWDVVRGEELLGQSKVVLAGDLRLAAHRVADEIHERLTGEVGVNATRIAYVIKTGRRYALHITDADGEGGQVALASAEPIISPTWSPDGQRLAYVSFEMQKAVVWIQNLANGERRVLANFRGSNSAPAFSPDGQRVALTLSRSGIAQIHLMDLNGGNVVQVTRSNAIDTEPVFAPDGRSLYFVSDRGGGPQIYRTALDGSGVQRITFQSPYAVSPCISPDGRLLAYISRQGSAYRLMTQDLIDGSIGTPTDTVDDESPSFAPNGRLIVYCTRQRGSDVLMTTTLDGRIKTRLLGTGADMREPAWGPMVR